ncbi:hypothetical protein Emag_003914 [Eimeria magna]
MSAGVRQSQRHESAAAVAAAAGPSHVLSGGARCGFGGSPIAAWKGASISLPACPRGLPSATASAEAAAPSAVPNPSDYSVEWEFGFPGASAEAMSPAAQPAAEAAAPSFAPVDEEDSSRKSGKSSSSRMRLTLTLSNNHVYACITDRSRQHTFAFASSMDKCLRDSLPIVKRKRGKNPAMPAVTSVARCRRLLLLLLMLLCLPRGFCLRCCFAYLLFAAGSSLLSILTCAGVASACCWVSSRDAVAAAALLAAGSCVVVLLIFWLVSRCHPFCAVAVPLSLHPGARVRRRCYVPQPLAWSRLIFSIFGRCWLVGRPHGGTMAAAAAVGALVAARGLKAGISKSLRDQRWLGAPRNSPGAKSRQRAPGHPSSIWRARRCASRRR